MILTHFVSQDIETLKRSLHYAKHVLQADYENKLQERALDLYCRVNDRILELEKQHEEVCCQQHFPMALLEQ